MSDLRDSFVGSDVPIVEEKSPMLVKKKRSGEDRPAIYTLWFTSKLFSARRTDPPPFQNSILSIAALYYSFCLSACVSNS